MFNYSTCTLEELFNIAKVNAEANKIAQEVLQEIRNRVEELLRIHNEIDKMKSRDWI